MAKASNVEQRRTYVPRGSPDRVVAAGYARTFGTGLNAGPQMTGLPFPTPGSTRECGKFGHIVTQGQAPNGHATKHPAPFFLNLKASARVLAALDKPGVETDIGGELGVEGGG